MIITSSAWYLDAVLKLSEGFCPNDHGALRANGFCAQECVWWRLDGTDVVCQYPPPLNVMMNDEAES